MSERARSISAARLAASGVKSGGQQPHRDGASKPRVARAEQLARTRRLEPFEQVVMRNDADRRRSGVAHPALSSSMTLCSSSFASPICSTTSAMSSVGLPGHSRALAIHAVLSHHRERVGQQIERHRQPPLRRSHHRLVNLERVAMLVECGHRLIPSWAAATAGSRPGSAGCAAGYAISSVTTCATSSGASFHSSSARRSAAELGAHRSRQDAGDANAVLPHLLHQRLA